MRGIFGLVIAMFLGMVAFSAVKNYHVSTYTITVQDKERVCENKHECSYLIFTDKGVFENTDTIWHLKWDSSDFYNDLHVGKVYEVEAVGWRVPFFSMYKNIISFKEKQ